MDGTTEPVVAVIGHPIAGNPSQFAFERALRAMEFEWRVLSFDVSPETVAAALDGAEALGFRGVFIDPSVADAATLWCRTRQPEADRIDCLFREQRGPFQGENEQRAWIADAVRLHSEKLGREIQRRIFLGEQVDASLISREADSNDPTSAPPDPDEIAEADIVFVSGSAGGPVPLEVDEWIPSGGGTLVVDLSDGHPEIAKIQDLGYQVLSLQQRRIGTLARCLQRWTGSDPASDVIHDAIEEYMAV